MDDRERAERIRAKMHEILDAPRWGLDASIELAALISGREPESITSWSELQMILRNYFDAHDRAGPRRLIH